MNDVGWFAIMVCVGLICFFGFLSIQSIGNGLTAIADKSDDWKEISIQLNESMNKVIEIQRMQNENRFDENITREMAVINVG